MNRLAYIIKQCRNLQITFKFTAIQNSPADCLTRPCSFQQLNKTNFLTGYVPYDSADLPAQCEELSATLPRPLFVYPDLPEGTTDAETYAACALMEEVSLVPDEKYSSFGKLIKITYHVMKYLNQIKIKVNSRRNGKKLLVKTDKELYSETAKYHLRLHQAREFRTELIFFNLNKST